MFRQLEASSSLSIKLVACGFGAARNPYPIARRLDLIAARRERQNTDTYVRGSELPHHQNHGLEARNWGGRGRKQVRGTATNDSRFASTCAEDFSVTLPVLLKFFLHQPTRSATYWQRLLAPTSVRTSSTWSRGGEAPVCNQTVNAFNKPTPLKFALCEVQIFTHQTKPLPSV